VRDDPPDIRRGMRSQCQRCHHLYFVTPKSTPSFCEACKDTPTPQLKTQLQGNELPTLECPCCGGVGAMGPVSDGQQLCCGCPGWVSVDAESDPYINSDDDECVPCELRTRTTPATRLTT
jgi:hypothetical protein